MNCEKVQSKMSELSADNLSSRDASSMLAHFATCTSCQQCWEEYQQTMFVLSTSTQPIPGASRSQQMWIHYQQRIAESEIDSRYSTPARAALRNSIDATAGNSLWSWMGIQPRWGWIALGGAMAALAGAWFASTPAPGPDNSTSITTAQLFAPSHVNNVDYPPAPATGNTPLDLPSFNNSSPTVFAAPTTPASPFVDHHSPMNENPLQDAASSSVVSYTVPSNNN
jgi:hypothetical protein